MKAFLQSIKPVYNTIAYFIDNGYTEAAASVQPMNHGLA